MWGTTTNLQIVLNTPPQKNPNLNQATHCKQLSNFPTQNIFWSLDSLRSWQDSWVGKRRQSRHITSEACEGICELRSQEWNFSTRLFIYPLMASPMAFMASLPKQKHSRAKSRQLRRLISRKPPSLKEEIERALFSQTLSFGEGSCNTGLYSRLRTDLHLDLQNTKDILQS